METLLLLCMILVTVVLIVCVYMLAYPPKPIWIWPGHGVRQEDLYLCKDIVCKYGQKYCCMSCGQRKECEACCEYDGSCEWRVKA